jgi:hypothetical protein
VWRHRDPRKFRSSHVSNRIVVGVLDAANRPFREKMSIRATRHLVTCKCWCPLRHERGFHLHTISSSRSCFADEGPSLNSLKPMSWVLDFRHGHSSEMISLLIFAGQSRRSGHKRRHLFGYRPDNFLFFVSTRRGRCICCTAKPYCRTSAIATHQSTSHPSRG